MSERMIAEALAVVCIVLFFALLFKAQDASHWKHSYETLRNEVLAQGQHESRRIIRGLQDVQAQAMSLEEFVDSQG